MEKWVVLAEQCELTVHLYSLPVSIIWWFQGQCGRACPTAQSLKSLTFSDPTTSPSVTSRGAHSSVSFPAASCTSAKLNLISVSLPVLFSFPTVPFLTSCLPVKHLLTVQPSAQVLPLCWNLFVLHSFVLPYSCHSELVSLLFYSHDICKCFLHHLQHFLHLYLYTSISFFCTERILLQLSSFSLLFFVYP